MFEAESYTNVGLEIQFKHKTCNLSLYTSRDLVGESPAEALEKAKLYCQRQMDEQRLRVREHTKQLEEWQERAHKVIIRKQKLEGVSA